MNNKDLDKFLDEYIEFKKISFLTTLKNNIKESKNVNWIDLKSEDLLFLILVYLKELLNRNQK